MFVMQGRTVQNKEDHLVLVAADIRISTVLESGNLFKSYMVVVFLL